MVLIVNVPQQLICRRLGYQVVALVEDCRVFERCGIVGGRAWSFFLCFPAGLR